MLRRRQEKIARHKLRRAARRRVLRDAPMLGEAFAAIAQAKFADVKEADAAAAMLTELQGTDDREPHSRAETWKPLTRIDGRWYLTYRGHALRLATIGLLLLAALIVAVSHPLGGGVATAATVIAFRTPAVGSVLALLGMFPVTRYGAKGDGTTDNAPAFTSAITAANAAGGGDVLVPKATGVYMLTGGQALMKNNVSIVGMARPTIKLIGGASIDPGMFRSQIGLQNWGVRGLILDGNQSAVTSVAGTNAAITIGRNNTDIRIVDNEIANTPNAFITTAAFVAGDTGILRVRLLNNNMHDAVGIGNKNGVYAEAWKDSLIVGNRIVNSYDDNMALISSGVDANDFCTNNVIAFNTCTTSRIASNIIINGYNHRCCFNYCADNGWGNNGYEIGAIRIRSSTGDSSVPYDIICSYNHIATWMDGVAGSVGIYVEAARSQVTHNKIMMPAATTSANLIGIRVSSPSGTPGGYPTPLGEITVDDNHIHGGFRSIEYVPRTTGVTKVRIRRNNCFGANSYGILLRPIDADFLEVSENLTEGCASDGINWAGTWTDGLASNNTARNCTGYGLNISSGTQVSTRTRGNLAYNCTAGASNFGVPIISLDVAFANDAGQPGLVAPTTRIWAPAQIAVATANRLYLARLRTAGRAIAMINFGFTVNVASSADDPWDVAVYDAAGNKLVASGATLGKVNTIGSKKVPLVVTLAPNTTYYLGMVGAVTSLLRFMGASYVNSGLTKLFAGTIPLVDAAFADIGAATTPATLPALSAPVEVPLMVALEN